MGGICTQGITDVGGVALEAAIKGTAVDYVGMSFTGLVRERFRQN